MPLPDTDLGWVEWLSRRHDAELPALKELNDLYEGTAPLHYLHPEIQREVDERIRAVSLGWPMLAVDPLEERLDVIGFRYPEDDDDPEASPEELASYAGDRNLQRVWADNDLAEESQMGHIDALVMRRAYVCVGTNEDDPDTPLTTVESPLEMYAYIDPRTRRERAALRRWSEDEDSLVRETQRYATLYLPERTVWYQQGRQGWEETGRDEHGLGEVPVVSLVNRGRLADRYGKSELTPALLSLSHAANKIATDMMVAAEFHAIPLRAIFGIGPEDLQDEQGNRLSALQVIMGRLLTLPTDDGNKIRPHEFSASSLANFHATLEALARRIVPLIGLPPDMVGLTSENPASAEARRSAEARLIKRAERKQVPFGAGWRRWARLVRRLQEGDWDPRARRIEVIWRDPATPTRSQAADAALKLLAEGAITKRQAREDMGYTPGQIRRMEAEDRAEAERDPVRQIVDRMGGGRAEPVTANVG